MKAAPESILEGLDDCPLQRKTPFGMKYVSDGYFSIARFYGRINFNGDGYTYFADSDELIRDDVLKWKRKRAKAQRKP